MAKNRNTKYNRPNPTYLDTMYDAQTVGLVNQIHDKNKDKDFVKRIDDLNKKPIYDNLRIRNNDGTYSTHKMMSGEVNGKGIAFPSIVKTPDGRLTELSPDEAFNYAKKNKEAIIFDTPEQAEWYAQNYKTIFRNGGVINSRTKYGKGGFWNTIGDYAKMSLVDARLSMIGMKDVITEDNYKTKFFQEADDVVGTVMPIAGQIAVAAATGGSGIPIMSAVQSAGSAANEFVKPQDKEPTMINATSVALPTPVTNTPTYNNLAKGGRLRNNNSMLNKFNGPSHEEGGIAIGTDNEVEGGETNIKDYVFSDTLLVPGTKVTFATMSKRIDKKYGLRKNDSMSEKAKAKELEELKALQEEVKFEEDAAMMQQIADTNPQLFEQLTGVNANPEVQELMPGQEQTPQMVDVPIQGLRKGGRLIRNKSTILGVSSPGVTMEMIRSGRHYIDTLVAVTHNNIRRRRYSGGGPLKDNHPATKQTWMDLMGELGYSGTGSWSDYNKQLIDITGGKQWLHSESDEQLQMYRDAVATHLGKNKPQWQGFNSLQTQSTAADAPVAPEQSSYITTENTPHQYYGRKAQPDVPKQFDYGWDVNSAIDRLANGDRPAPLALVPLKNSVSDSGLTPMTPKGASEIPNPNLTSPNEIKPRNIGKVDGTTTKNKSSLSGTAIAGMGLQGAGLLAKGLLLAKRNKYMPAEYTPVAPVSFERLSAREPLAQAKSAYSGYNTALARNASGVGQFLSNRAVSGAGEAMSRASIVENINNKNAQIQAAEATKNAEIALNNAQMKLQVGEINQREYDSITQAWNEYINDIIGVGSGITKDITGYKSQDLALQNLGTSGVDVLYGKDGVQYVVKDGSFYQLSNPHGELKSKSTATTTTKDKDTEEYVEEETIEEEDNSTAVERYGGYLKRKRNKKIA